MTKKTALTPAESITLPGTESGANSNGFKQWVGSVAVNGQQVRYDLFEPCVPLEDTPILINNGYCAPAIVYDALAQAIAKEGRTVVRYHPPRHVALHRAVVHGHFANPLKKHADASEAVTEDVMAQMGVAQIDAIGHSTGAPVSFQVAKRIPEAFRSIMATGAAGLVDSDGIVRMGLRAIKLLKTEIYDEMERLAELGETSEVARQVFEHIMLHPVDTLAEGYYISHLDVVSDLERAHEAGIRIGALLFGRDTFFKAPSVVQRVGTHLDFVEIIEDAKHIHPQIHSRRHAAEQVSAFAALNAPTSLPQAS